MRLRTVLPALAIAAAALPAAAQVDEATIARAAADTLTVPTLEPVGGEMMILSREECIRIALEENPTIRVADLEVKRMDYSKKETLAGVFPTIDFSGAYQRSIELQTMSMSMGGHAQKIKMGMDNSWNFGFTATMPIIAAQLWQSIKLSDTQILSTLESARASRLDLVNNVNKTYYALLLAKASYDVIRQSYDVAVFNADLYKKQFEAGTATEYDVLRTEVEVKNMEPQLLEAEIAIKQCKLQLKLLLGFDTAVDIEPNISLSDMQREMYGYAISVSERSLADNTSLRSLDLQTKALKQTVNLRKYAWIPTLGAQFNYSWMALSNGNAMRNQDFNPYSNVALSLSVPIFSGGSKYNALRQAQTQLKEMEFQRENLVNSLNMQVDLALDNINKEIKQISTSEEGVRQADKAYQIMQKSFEIGAASYLNLRDSELARTSSRLSYYQAIYNYLCSTSELDMLLGREDALRQAGYVSTGK